MSGSPPAESIHALNGLNRLIHEPARLTLMAFLYVVESGDYTFLMSETEMTWGNLSAHLNKLQEAGYVEIEKGYKGKKPNTMVRLTESGREAFKAYRQGLRQALDHLPD